MADGNFKRSSLSKANGRVDLNSCFQCHKNGDSVNFMFTAAQLKSAAK
jgi:hypothetical protein